MRCTIFVDGGLVDDVIIDNSDMSSTQDYIVIDFDSLDDGRCPVCDCETERRDAKVIAITVTEIVYREESEEEIDGVRHIKRGYMRNPNGEIMIGSSESVITSGGIDFCTQCNWNENMNYREIHKMAWEDK